MNVRGIALSLILGVSMPNLLAVAFNAPALAQTENFPVGDYLDGSLYVNIEGNQLSDLTIRVQDLSAGDPISLSGATLSGTNERRIYTWENSSRRYQVAWRPSDSEVIRLQIFTSSGQEIENRLIHVPD